MPVVSFTHRRRLLPAIPTVFGTAFAGGFYAGKVTLPGGEYAIVVSPKATGESQKQLQSSSTIMDNAVSLTDSAGNTDALLSTSAAAQWVRSLNIGGFTDWQIPARDVWGIVLQNLAPGVASTPAAFKTGGAEAVTPNNQYWTSSCSDWVSDDSYYDQGPPIYETVQIPHEYSGTNQRWATDGVSWEPTCPHGIAPGGVEELGRNGNEAFYQWDCSGTYYTTEQQIVGYEQGAYHEVYTDHYDAYQMSAYSNGGYSSSRYTRGATKYVRAIRLVKAS